MFGNKAVRNAQAGLKCIRGRMIFPRRDNTGAEQFFVIPSEKPSTVSRRTSGMNMCYITVDLDCLQAGDAVTNWENGKFAPDDVAWALGRLWREGRVVGGDICGAYSRPTSRWKQCLVSKIDHPRFAAPDKEQARSVNLVAFEKLWPVLIGGLTN